LKLLTTAIEAEEGALKVKVRWLITKEIGAENFAMRLFEIEPGGYTPLHSHPWEHEVFILEGEGVVIGENKERACPTSYHSLTPLSGTSLHSC
jgi:quercetin dioxygenase-like cupin family protein